MKNELAADFIQTKIIKIHSTSYFCKKPFEPRIIQILNCSIIPVCFCDKMVITACYHAIKHPPCTHIHMHIYIDKGVNTHTHTHILTHTHARI